MTSSFPAPNNIYLVRIVTSLLRKEFVKLRCPHSYTVVSQAHLLSKYCKNVFFSYFRKSMTSLNNCLIIICQVFFLSNVKLCICRWVMKNCCFMSDVFQRTVYILTLPFNSLSVAQINSCMRTDVAPCRRHTPMSLYHLPFLLLLNIEYFK